MTTISAENGVRRQGVGRAERGSDDSRHRQFFPLPCAGSRDCTQPSPQQLSDLTGGVTARKLLAYLKPDRPFQVASAPSIHSDPLDAMHASGQATRNRTLNELICNNDEQ